jgi:hypothetical protein
MHSECASGVCGADGSCVAESQIAYVDVTGSQAADCSMATPCSTVTRALQVGKEFVSIGTGTYTSSAALNMNGQHSLIGRGLPLPVLSRSTAGSVLTITTGKLTLEHLVIRDASLATDDYGAGVLCTSLGGAPEVHLKDVTLRENEIGLRGQNCTMHATASSLISNTSGASLTDSTASFDQCLVTLNGGGLSLDGGQYSVTNSFIVRNSPPSTATAALDLFTSQNGTRVEFNTIADNAGIGFRCGLQNVTGAFPSNIIARNMTQTQGPNCSFPSSIIVDTDVSAIKFVSATASPYDYHLGAGSIAIDAATVSTNDHDYDDDARPQGAGRDVGADEFKP